NVTCNCHAGGIMKTEESVLAIDLLELLCCPSCKGELVSETSAQILRCDVCRFRFPIINGIPVLFPCDVAEKFPELFSRHWDPEDMAERYDYHVEGASSALAMYVHRGEMHATLQGLGTISAGARLLDCGCGNGRLFDRLPKGIIAVGIDASLNLLRIVQRKGR